MHIPQKEYAFFVHFDDKKYYKETSCKLMFKIYLCILTKNLI